MQKSKIKDIIGTTIALSVLSLMSVVELAGVKDIQLKELPFLFLGVFSSVCIRHFIKPKIESYLAKKKDQKPE